MIRNWSEGSLRWNFLSFVDAHVAQRQEASSNMERLLVQGSLEEFPDFSDLFERQVV